MELPPISAEYAVLGGSTAFAVGYLIAFFGGSRAVRRERTRMQAEASRLEAQLRREQAWSRLYIARGALYRAAAELSMKNYGTARDYVRQATDDVSHIDPQAAGIPQEVLEAIILRVGDVSLTEDTASADIGLLAQLGERFGAEVS